MQGSPEARAYLESLQAKVYSRLPQREEGRKEFADAFLEQFIEKQRSLYTPEEFEQYQKELRAQVKAAFTASVPTKYEDPGWYSVLTNLAERTDKAASKLGMTVPVAPLLGTLPSGRVNAAAICLGPKDYIIVFEVGLFGFANLLSKVIALAMPFRGDVDGKLEFGTEITTLPEEAVARFQDVLFAYLFLGHPHFAQPYLPPPHLQGVASLLRKSMELFVLGHEYGHIISGHFGNALPSSNLLGGVNTEEVTRSWIQEFEADAVGTSLVVSAMAQDGMDLALSFWGADFFFSCIEIIERTVSIIRTGKADEIHLDSHPPAHMRREQLRQSLVKSIDAEYKGRAEGAVELGKQLERIVEQLWDSTAPVVMQFRRRKTPLAPQWV